MAASPSLLELVATAQAPAKLSEDRISQALIHLGGSNETELHAKELRRASKALELVAVDIFSTFEARMQHHFKRGPFSRKLKTRLLESKQPDLADRLHKYYLAVNVLKHGKGASYRELLKSPTSLFAVTAPPADPRDEAQANQSLIDVTAPGFFEGLTDTIIEAYHFLEGK